MMPGIKSLRKIQLGLESPKGTIVPATAVWRGVGTIEDARTQIFPPEDIGIVGGVDRSFVPALLGKLTMDATPATYEQIGYILSAGVKDVVTGSADGAGTDKIYTYAFPTTAQPTTKAYTLQGGDDQQAEVVEYGFVESFQLDGKPSGELTMSANWVGRQVAPQAFTGSLVIPTVEDILFNKGRLAIDAIGGTVGATQKSNTFIGMSFKCKTGLIPVFTADTNAYFSFSKYTQHDITCDVTFEHDASATAQIVNWRAQTPLLMQCRFDGNAPTTPGTTYTKKTLIINMAGKWSKFTKIGEVNGNDIVTGTFAVKYDVTAATNCTIIVVNELSALV